jgi:hypothetical protein
VCGSGGEVRLIAPVSGGGLIDNSKTGWTATFVTGLWIHGDIFRSITLRRKRLRRIEAGHSSNTPLFKYSATAPACKLQHGYGIAF